MLFCQLLRMLTTGALLRVCRDLEGVGLQGSIAPGGWVLPESLELLNLASNTLQGSIPEDWTLPGELTLLVLHNNSLTGEPAISLPEHPLSHHFKLSARCGMQCSATDGTACSSLQDFFPLGWSSRA